MSRYSLNDTVYRAKIDSNVFNREKIFMTDTEGNEWYRYDKPAYSYAVVPLQIVAIESHSLQSLPGYYVDVDLETHYYFSDSTSANESEIDEPTKYCTLFTSYTAAESAIEAHKTNVL